ncbi:hypothetical protein [Rubripirellula reticaptiva]|uniref:hypothetical protein n=1 Tax=Rubripirellula reticaptiva TaxID=2528013 RepID=UPI001647E51F|nr:hypothetical protein [Rubripirellula reticaptiva]
MSFTLHLPEQIRSTATNAEIVVIKNIWKKIDILHEMYVDGFGQATVDRENPNTRVFIPDTAETRCRTPISQCRYFLLSLFNQLSAPGQLSVGSKKLLCVIEGDFTLADYIWFTGDKRAQWSQRCTRCCDRLRYKRSAVHVFSFGLNWPFPLLLLSITPL